MKFHYTNLETCHTATGLVAVIDVIRAFTNAAFAFSRGAEIIYPVSGVDEALALKRQLPNALACGEVGGIPPEGFDFGNSPTQTDALALTGRVVVQRTGAGTQGVVRSVNASKMVAASFVVASATVKYIQSIQPDEVSFVVTGATYDGGAEDLACAEYLESLLCDSSTDVRHFLQRVRDSHDGQQFLNGSHPHAPITDLDHCLSVDKFNFAMPVACENGRFIMRAVRPNLIPGT
ncbi:MAG: 2-phosphosulfolactate phosphatase [Chloroflexota bacterium]